MSGFGHFAFVFNPSVLANASKISAGQQGALGKDFWAVWKGVMPFSHAWNYRLCQAGLIGCGSSFHKMLVTAKDYSSAWPWINETSSPHSWDHIPLCQVSSLKNLLLEEIKRMLLPYFFVIATSVYTPRCSPVLNTESSVHLACQLSPCSPGLSYCRMWCRDLDAVNSDFTEKVGKSPKQTQP